jgi:hypothetical protein
MSLLIPHCDILLHTIAHTCLLFLEVNFIFQQPLQTPDNSAKNW